MFICSSNVLNVIVEAVAVFKVWTPVNVVFDDDNMPVLDDCVCAGVDDKFKRLGVVVVVPLKMFVPNFKDEVVDVARLGNENVFAAGVVKGFVAVVVLTAKLKLKPDIFVNLKFS